MSSSPFPFGPSTAAGDNRRLPPLPPPPLPQLPSSKSNLTTCLYQTELGLFSLTWSRTFLGHSLHLNLHHHNHQNSLSPVSLSNQLSLSSVLSFHLHIKPYLFWRRHGSKKLHFPNRESGAMIKVLWDLSGAKFGSGPEPVSGFYIAVVVNREMILLVGDRTKEACSKSRASLPAKPEMRRNQVPVLREEHVHGNRVYVTNARFGDKNRVISIDCSTSRDASLYFYVDKQRVLKVKRLKWKFRGSERVEVDGVPVNISWDVYSWLFDCSNIGGHAVFMFRFESLDNEEQGEREKDCCYSDKDGVVDLEKDGGAGGGGLWQQKSFSGVELNGNGGGGGGGGGVSSEWMRIRKSLMKMRTARSSSSSSISMSSASSGCSSSVMEWSSVEENELTSAVGFSLLVHAWRK